MVGSGALARVTKTGIVDTPFVAAPPSVGVSTSRVTLRSDGKILVAVQVGEAATSRCTVTRYLPNGALDGVFGNGGTTTLPASPCALARLAIQPDGRIRLGSSSLVRLWN